MKYLLTNKQLQKQDFPHVEANHRVLEKTKGLTTIYYDSANMVEFDNSIALTEGYIF
ncbi:MAG: hypothetical protein H6604_01025 [Flavobacteriales bacterium]|nr:hypothetical protein [Flavobacteriales bacterium]